MSHEVETMAYQGKTPWHGLGVAVDSSASVDEWLSASGMDWSVEMKPVQVEGATVEGYRAIRRDSDGKVFAVVSDRYKPIQNQELYGFFRDYCEAGEMEIESAGSLKGGARVWALAKLNGGFELAGGDKTNTYVLLASGHDGQMALVAKPTGVRVVCWNTLQLAMPRDAAGRVLQDSTTFKLAHSRKFDRQAAEHARETVGLARSAFAQAYEQAQELSEARIQTKAAMHEYILRLTQPHLFSPGGELSSADSVLGSVLDATETPAQDGLLDSVLDATATKQTEVTDHDLNRAGAAILDTIISSPGADLPSARGTWWGVVNGVTRYYDHGQEGSQRDRDSRLNSAWFGGAARKKQEAVRLALDFARRA